MFNVELIPSSRAATAIAPESLEMQGAITIEEAPALSGAVLTFGLLGQKIL
jgi:hypothetical protein